MNVWGYTSTPQYTFMAWCSVKKKHRDKFTLPLPQSILRAKIKFHIYLLNLLTDSDET
jgi:hypothetical protein